ncbi:MAG: DUF1573 domain-containing protein [Bacteroidaceae bacterium]|nr:DUF1573 domain-containing protein [Bacteroidaceae bacterium]
MKKTTIILAVLALMTFLAASQMRTATASTLMSMAAPENQAEIKFDTVRVDLGTFSEKQGEQHCTFTFTNVGTAPLIINQAFASCGCTVPTYTKDPIKPGETGKIDVTYNGRGKFPGRFSKTITIRSNARTEIVRLVVEGTMTK